MVFTVGGQATHTTLPPTARPGTHIGVRLPPVPPSLFDVALTFRRSAARTVPLTRTGHSTLIK